MADKNRSLVVEVDEQSFSFETGMEFRGMTISQKNDQWNFVLRGVDSSGVPVYCMSQSEDLHEAVTSLMDTMKSKDSKYLWRLDGWAR